MCSVEQGVIWFLIAAVAEVPPAVRYYWSLDASHFWSSLFCVAGVPYFGHEWYLFSLLLPLRMLTWLACTRNSRCAQRCTFFLSVSGEAVPVSHTVTHPATQMFQIPALIVLTIAATRMYRSLINFSSDTYGLLI
jgi:hypothetical protein